MLSQLQYISDNSNYIEALSDEKRAVHPSSPHETYAEYSIALFVVCDCSYHRITLVIVSITEIHSFSDRRLLICVKVLNSTWNVS